jgi:predicted transcriptional regulator of viral defense system
MMPDKGDSLAAYVDSLHASGRYVFTRSQALAALGTTPGALKKAAQRLLQKCRLAMPRRGFYVIVPLEYRVAGAPPASWFIDELMCHEGRSYYVGLLTAAALHGAAHHQPQEFQVMTSQPLRPIEIGRHRIRYFVRQKAAANRPRADHGRQDGYRSDDRLEPRTDCS